MNLYSILLKLRLRIIQLILPKKLLSTGVRQSIALCVEAIAEDLDQVVEIENCFPGRVEYCTVHGCRVLSCDRLEVNQFLVLKKGGGFARAGALPYLYFPNRKSPDSLLKTPPMPAALAEIYPLDTIIVRVTSDNQEAAEAGYASAVPIAVSRNDVYVEDMQMLDTEYANSLVDIPRFG